MGTSSVSFSADAFFGGGTAFSKLPPSLTDIVGSGRPVGGSETPAGHLLRGGAGISFSCRRDHSTPVCRVYNSIRDIVGFFAQSEGDACLAYAGCKMQDSSELTEDCAVDLVCDRFSTSLRHIHGEWAPLGDGVRKDASDLP